MSGYRFVGKIILAAGFFTSAVSVSSFAQAKKDAPSAEQTGTANGTQEQVTPSSGSAGSKPEGTVDAASQKQEAEKKTPADPKQAQLQADIDKLYQLTQELKTEVAKSNKDVLSVAVIKKADEVEKLARSVKERTRDQQQ